MNSLQPDEYVLHAYVDGDTRARAIVEAWKPRLEITYMTLGELQELSRCRYTVFNLPRMGDLSNPSYSGLDLPQILMAENVNEEPDNDSFYTDPYQPIE